MNHTNQHIKSINNALTEAGKIILGKETQIKLAFSCLFAQGHLLIEDLPGMGKTTLSHVLAKMLGLKYSRIQFTSDLLPADILGVSIFEKSTGQFNFLSGPIFAQVVLADEINRATPKTQSALLEAMEERQVTIEGETRNLPKPFFVIATQNPTTQTGTYPLPESQLDRFLMRIELGYPGPAAEREILKGIDRREMLENMTTQISPEELVEIQNAVLNVHCSDAILDYIQRIVQFSRNTSEFVFGLSPRASLAIMKTAQAWTYIEGRDHVLPDDIQAVLTSVVEHRLNLLSTTLNQSPGQIGPYILENVEVIE